MTIKPITPKEAHKKFCEEQIPDFVIEVVNNLLAKESSRPNRKVKLKQDDITEKIMERDEWPKDAATQLIIDQHWLDFETLYQEAGWDVKYDKPSIGDSYDAYFTFTPIAK